MSPLGPKISVIYSELHMLQNKKQAYKLLWQGKGVHNTNIKKQNLGNNKCYTLKLRIWKITPDVIALMSRVLCLAFKRSVIAMIVIILLSRIICLLLGCGITVNKLFGIWKNKAIFKV